MRAWRGITLVLAVGLAAFGPGLAEGRSGDDLTPLQRVIDRLGEEAQFFDPGAIVGISVQRLDTGETADFQGDRWLKSASSLKPTWVAAAVRASGIDAVEPHGRQIWIGSSNKTGGLVIGLAGGLDAVNEFTSGLGMNTTLVVEWTPGGDWRSSEYPGPHPALNFTSADDLVTFWRLVVEGYVLSPSETEWFLDWASVERQPGYPSGLLTRLPDEVRPHAAYKMGWLPPGRTEEDEETGEIIEVDALDTLVGSGVIDVPGSPPYVVAIGSFGGASWPGKITFMAYAACRIHEVIIGEELTCDRRGDPTRTRLDPAAPVGGLVHVGGDAEFVEVRGWAVDPDDPVAPITVRFRIDGRWSGSDGASDARSWGVDPLLAGEGHGFSDVLLAHLAPGEHEICAVAINDGRGPNTDIGCRQLVVR
jgi:hypothetical protein